MIRDTDNTVFTDIHKEAALSGVTIFIEEMNATSGVYNDNATLKFAAMIPVAGYDVIWHYVTDVPKSDYDRYPEAVAEQREPMYRNRYGRIAYEKSSFWTLIAIDAVKLYGDKPARRYWLYGATHRPMSEMWARMDGVRYINAEGDHASHGVHTWAVATRRLTDAEIDTYELTPTAEV